MKDEDIQNLLGGFATDTLTDRERELLFTASLTNQELFNALADDQALREFLAIPPPAAACCWRCRRANRDFSSGSHRGCAAPPPGPWPEV